MKRLLCMALGHRIIGGYHGGGVAITCLRCRRRWLGFAVRTPE